jgi:hypothetical protein
MSEDLMIANCDATRTGDTINISNIKVDVDLGKRFRLSEIAYAGGVGNKMLIRHGLNETAYFTMGVLETAQVQKWDMKTRSPRRFYIKFTDCLFSAGHLVILTVDN